MAHPPALPAMLAFLMVFLSSFAMEVNAQGSDEELDEDEKDIFCQLMEVGLAVPGQCNYPLVPTPPSFCEAVGIVNAEVPGQCGQPLVPTPPDICETTSGHAVPGSCGEPVIPEVPGLCQFLQANNIAVPGSCGSELIPSTPNPCDALDEADMAIPGQCGQPVVPEPPTICEIIGASLLEVPGQCGAPLVPVVPTPCTLVEEAGIEVPGQCGAPLLPAPPNLCETLGATFLNIPGQCGNPIVPTIEGYCELFEANEIQIPGQCGAPLIPTTPGYCQLAAEVGVVIPGQCGAPLIPQTPNDCVVMDSLGLSIPGYCGSPLFPDLQETESSVPVAVVPGGVDYLPTGVAGEEALAAIPHAILFVKEGEISSSTAASVAPLVSLTVVDADGAISPSAIAISYQPLGSGSRSEIYPDNADEDFDSDREFNFGMVPLGSKYELVMGSTSRPFDPFSKTSSRTDDGSSSAGCSTGVSFANGRGTHRTMENPTEGQLRYVEWANLNIVGGISYWASGTGCDGMHPSGSTGGMAAAVRHANRLPLGVPSDEVHVSLVYQGGGSKSGTNGFGWSSLTTRSAGVWHSPEDNMYSLLDAQLAKRNRDGGSSWAAEAELLLDLIPLTYEQSVVKAFSVYGIKKIKSAELDGGPSGDLTQSGIHLKYGAKSVQKETVFKVEISTGTTSGPSKATFSYALQVYGEACAHRATCTAFNDWYVIGPVTSNIYLGDP